MREGNQLSPPATPRPQTHEQPLDQGGSTLKAPAVEGHSELLIVDALEGFVRQLSRAHRLTVSETGLLVKSSNGGFVRYDPSRMSRDQELFIRCDLAVGVRHITERVVDILGTQLCGLDQAYEVVSSSIGATVPKTKFGAFEQDGSMYIRINPFIESPLAGRNLFANGSRRDLFRTLYLTAGTTIGAHGAINFRGDWKSFLKIGALAYTAPKLAHSALWSMANALSNRAPHLAIDSSPQHFENFRGRVFEQLTGSGTE